MAASSRTYADFVPSLAREVKSMRSPAQGIRSRAPLMYAFRSAFKDKDARKVMDLREASGERVLAGRRSSSRALATEAALQGEILLDLTQLLNTINLASCQDLGERTEVARSILNYGIPDVAHRTIDEVGVEEIVGELETALVHYEPRIVARSLLIRRDGTVDKSELKVRFLVSAEVAMEPENIPVEFVADIEASSGKISVMAV